VGLKKRKKHGRRGPRGRFVAKSIDMRPFQYLLTSKSADQIATLIGCSTRTVYRYRKLLHSATDSELTAEMQVRRTKQTKRQKDRRKAKQLYSCQKLLDHGRAGKTAAEDSATRPN
jgi:hypothetical protein